MIYGLIEWSTTEILHEFNIKLIRKIASECFMTTQIEFQCKGSQSCWYLKVMIDVQFLYTYSYYFS